jgi:hypothetical protein
MEKKIEAVDRRLIRRMIKSKSYVQESMTSQTTPALRHEPQCA